MADPAHLEIAKKGTEAIALWRQSHPVEPLDLGGADLTGVNLSGADLTGADLFGANLSGANLSKADLSVADLKVSNLTGADLSGANLTGASLSVANLSKANLSGADLAVADLSGANLTGANFSSAQCFAAVFGDCDLSRCQGLEAVKHDGPSTIGIDTLLSTARAGGGRLAPPVRAFLLGAGVPRELLRMVPKLVREVRYYSAFIAYGSPDKDFAEKLYGDLEAKGVSCWLFDTDARVGRPVWGEIGKGRREADKVIVTCSAGSLVRDGLQKEIEETADEDPSKLVPISLDNIWTEEGFPVRRGARDLKPCLKDQIYPDFVGWKEDTKKYQEGLERLLKGLQREKAGKGG